MDVFPRASKVKPQNSIIIYSIQNQLCDRVAVLYSFDSGGVLPRSGVNNDERKRMQCEAEFGDSGESDNQ